MTPHLPHNLWLELTRDHRDPERWDDRTLQDYEDWCEDEREERDLCATPSITDAVQPH